MGAQQWGAPIGRLFAPGVLGRPDQRALTPAERALARQVFGDSLDLDPIVLTRDSLLAVVSATSVCNRVNLRSDHGHFEGPGMQLSQAHRATLIHELVHCWQYQHGGVAYMADSLWAQGLGMLRRGSRGAAYDWRRAVEAGQAWADWNPEQQAQCIEDGWSAEARGARALPAQQAALVELRARRGALRRSPAGAVVGGVAGALLGATLGLPLGPLGLGTGAAAGALVGAWGLGFCRPFRPSRHRGANPG